MANKKLSIVMIKEIIRLKQSGLSHQKIADLLSVSRTTVIKYVKQIDAGDYKYSELLEQNDQDLHELFSEKECDNKELRYSTLSNFFAYMDKELKRVGVTRWNLWAEYKRENRDGYSYSQFCYHYQQWCIHKEAYMHIDHKAGDKLFVDYAGNKLSIVDRETGEIKEVEVFVATLGASQKTYVEASFDQRLESFLRSVENALWYLGGVPRAIVPDNLKSAITKSDKYEPGINERFADFSAHYDTTILPARARKPKDKALVEGSVKIVYHRIYAALRNRVFYSIEELNHAIKLLLIDYNTILFQGKDHSRQNLFEELEKPALSALPTEKYEYKRYKQATVQKNCHVYLGEDKHYYSVPYKYIGKQVKIIYTSNTVEIYYAYKRLALHPRSRQKYGYTTEKEHLPSHHRFVAEWSPEKFIKWAGDVGEPTEQLIRLILQTKSHPEQGYKSCLGILSHARKVGRERLNKACERALYYQNYNYQVVKKILEKGLEQEPLGEQEVQTKLPFHDNIRGQEYYQ